MSNENAKVFKRCKMTTINKSDMPQVVPSEFSTNDLKSWSDKAIQELRYLRGCDSHDGERC